MLTMTPILTLFYVLFLGSVLGYKNYSGYQVLRTAPLNASQVSPTEALLRNFDLWSRPRVGRSVDVMVDPEQEPTLRKALHQLLGENPSTLIPDLGLVVEREREERIAAQRRDGDRVTPSFDRFLDLDEILAYLDEVVASYPNLATLIDIGQSYEGRPLRVLRLSNGGDIKPGFFIDSLMHGREWIGPPVVLYTIYQLTENYAQFQVLLDAVDFYFLVVANPDGYVYSWTEDRAWVKTRSENVGSECKGSDPIRNFDWFFAAEGKPIKCDNTYPGVEAFSEPETQALATFLTTIPRLSCYLSIGSWGQYLLYPWAYSPELAPNDTELSRIGHEAAAAILAVRGTEYEVSSGGNLFCVSVTQTPDVTRVGL